MAFNMQRSWLCACEFVRLPVLTQKSPLGGGYGVAHAANGYRADIDGLRAIAVIPVILFHFHFLKFGTGGFVGVDIFFVISGYLITQILVREMDGGTYSIAGFYSRRVRRIFPALFVVLAFCLSITLIKGFPADVHDLSRYIVSVIFFVSNVIFYSSSGYFDAGMAHNPLLHTWSLSVEEQFYVVFPLVLFALRNKSRRLQVLIVLVVAVVSFAEAVRTVQVDPSAAFYLLPSRAWELMLGALVAMGSLPKLRNRWLAELLGVAGLALIFASIKLLTPQTPFPGLTAVPPTLGAALIIYSGSDARTAVARLLASPPFRWVGLISYSMYLWHWPLFVFYTDSFPMPGTTARLALLAVCVLVSWASWRFVETPFRRARTDGNRRALAWGATAMASVCVVTISASAANAALRTIPESVQSTLAYLNYDADREMRAGTCFMIPDHGRNLPFDTGTCLKTSSIKKNVLLVGDSHAADLWAGFSSVYSGVNFLQATASGCKPLLNTTGPKRCTQLMRYVLTDFVPARKPDMIVLSGNWANQDINDVVATARYLGQYAERVVVLGPTPAYDQMLPRLLARSIYANDDTFVARHERRERGEMDTMFSRRLVQDSIPYVSTYQALCREQCTLWADKHTPMYFDDNHLTSAGARVLAERIRGELFDAKSSGDGVGKMNVSYH
ncbi:exopolysaccharide production protein ExoZ [Burkholderia multivorans]